MGRRLRECSSSSEIYTVFFFCVPESSKLQTSGRKQSVSRSLKHLFHSSNKFVKTLKRWVLCSFSRKSLHLRKSTDFGSEWKLGKYFCVLLKEYKIHLSSENLDKRVISLNTSQ